MEIESPACSSDARLLFNLELSWKKLRDRFSKPSSSDDGFQRVGSLGKGDIPLETQILSTSTKAEGRSLQQQELDWQNSKVDSVTQI